MAAAGHAKAELRCGKLLLESRGSRIGVLEEGIEDGLNPAELIRLTILDSSLTDFRWFSSSNGWIGPLFVIASNTYRSWAQSRGASQTLLTLSYSFSSSNQCERSDEVLECWKRGPKTAQSRSAN